MLIHSADVMETINSAGAFGIKAVVESVDWPGMVRRVFDDIDREDAEIEEENLSRGWPVEAAQEVGQRRLPTAAGPHHGHQLPCSTAISTPRNANTVAPLLS